MAQEERLTCHFDGATALSSFLSDLDEGDDGLHITSVSIEIDRETAIRILLKFFQHKKMDICAEDFDGISTADLIPATTEVFANTTHAWGLATANLSNHITAKKLR